MKSVLDYVLQHAEEDPQRLCVQLFSRRQKEISLSFGEVAEAAKRAAAFLNQQEIKRGDVVVLIGTHHIDFYANWLGIAWLGAIPTVLAEPSVRIDKQIYWSRMAALFERIQAKAITVDPRIKIESDLLSFNYSEVANGEGETPMPIKANPQDILLLQHSSGTTGLQKGVMLSHQAVMKHAESYFKALQLTHEDKIASWLPLYHDMGFIACFVNALIAGVPVVWLSPFEWVAAPSLLLDAISKHKATLTWLPNFAFAFLAQRVKENDDYDLSSLRAVINCSEPVTSEAMNAFAEKFALNGFRRDALQTCYAMAENVFAVTTTTIDIPPRFVKVNKREWDLNHRAVSVCDDETESITHVSNGVCVEGCDVRVVDEEGNELPSCKAGRVLIRSPFLFDGYHCREDLNKSLFDEEGFYDTGDVGYVDADGHVYITGRKKDLIIVGGRNLYPQDVEQIANETEGVHSGRAVCFGVVVEDLGTEGVVLLVESDLNETAWSNVIRHLRKTIPARLDLDMLDIRVVPTGTLRKSTAGKLARDGNREWYLEGKFGELPLQLKKQN
jgi:acyl-CoA synthetase (AMP-forming)/AMP-acid ligase II